jgi:hypothetical protein
MILLLLGTQGGGNAGNSQAFTDVTTAFIHHLAVIRQVPGNPDLTTLLAADVKTVRAAVSAGNKDDVNTAYAEYLLTNN